MSDSVIVRKKLRIAGQVQGVGFRPFVYRLACELRLGGYVGNDSRGVSIEVQGPAGCVREFLRRTRSECPPLASITCWDEATIEPVKANGQFIIAPSQGGELSDAQVTVDTAVCDDCLREMNDPTDPRHAYPFINCTNCGPRYTIVRRIPYDRPHTTMAQFKMCPQCRREYDDPSCRRFHAQPTACPTCGPKVWLTDSHGKPVQCDDAIAQAAGLLLAGKIVAIKGLGGFHLACRADDDHAVRCLRRRKKRDAKPFAVMVANLQRAKAYCRVPTAAVKLLCGPLRPIVLLDSLDAPAPVASSVAQGLRTLGLMLPYTPLHHLLFAAEGMTAVPLVMTSGNYSEEPLVKDNDAAVAHLGAIADAILMHDRPIERRVDDSVVQLHHEGPAVLRRARGYAPAPINVEVLQSEGAAESPAVLAVGAELKNTTCLLRGSKAVLSEHIGDLKDGRVYRHFIDTINHLEELFEVVPSAIAADLHPQYLSTQYALRRSRGRLDGKPAIPIIGVQHHHAHVVSCMAEHGRSQPVIGLACDGVGLGDDGAVWGCEVLYCELGSYRRLGHLRYLPLLGGDAAAVETSRPALAAMWDALGPQIIEMPLALRLAGGERHLEQTMQVLQAGLNCPPSSSLGRWFDAVSGLCNLAWHNDYEGQAPMLLEAAIADGVENCYKFEVRSAKCEVTARQCGVRSAECEVTARAELLSSTSHSALRTPHFLIDLRPMVHELVADVSAGYDVGVVAARFHNTVVQFLLESALRARDLTGLEVVALSGGCFANRYLRQRLTQRLQEQGFKVLSHHSVPTNDGGVALGQAVIAAAQMRGCRTPPG